MLSAALHQIETPDDLEEVTAMYGKACTTPFVDSGVFFPETPEQLAAAQAVCAGCPFAEQCLAEALAVGTTDGVWGGVLLDRGAVVAQKRRPGRPRKAAMAA